MYHLFFLFLLQFAANVLKELMLAAKLPGAEHEVVAVVTTQGREGARFDMQVNISRLLVLGTCSWWHMRTSGTNCTSGLANCLIGAQGRHA